MILVTLGTQDKQFKRLLEEVDNLINKGVIKDKVVVQAGMTKYESKNMEILSLIPRDEFKKLISKANLIITHGGVGSILTGLKENKKVIAVPRLTKYGEHQSDHQVEIIKRFSDAGYIIGLNGVEELKEGLNKVKTFKPKKFESDNSKMLNLISSYIKKDSRVLFISSTGGHLEELLELQPLFNKYKYYLVTEKTDTNMKLKDKYKKRISYLIYGTKVHPIIYIFKVFLNSLKSIYLYFKIRPKYIVTTGTHTAIPICTFSKLFGTKVIYIETFANSNTRTMTGNFLYKLKIYNLFIVQWEDMLKIYPKATYGGWIFN